MQNLYHKKNLLNVALKPFSSYLYFVTTQDLPWFGLLLFYSTYVDVTRR